MESIEAIEERKLGMQDHDGVSVEPKVEVIASSVRRRPKFIASIQWREESVISPQSKVFFFVLVCPLKLSNSRLSLRFLLFPDL